MNIGTCICLLGKLPIAAFNDVHIHLVSVVILQLNGRPGIGRVVRREQRLQQVIHIRNCSGLLSNEQWSFTNKYEPMIAVL